MPHLRDLHEKYRSRGFTVLGVAIDGPESRAQVDGVVSRFGLPFPVLLDDESRAIALFQPRVAAPYSVLVDRKGRIVERFEGYSSGAAERLDEIVRRILEER